MVIACCVKKLIKRGGNLYRCWGGKSWIGVPEEERRGGSAQRDWEKILQGRSRDMYWEDAVGPLEGILEKTSQGTNINKRQFAMTIEANNWQVKLHCQFDLS